MTPAPAMPEVPATPAAPEWRPPNPEQQAAIDAAGVVFVSAGAGTGKTTVLVERFARAVCERGIDIGSILVITYTDRAAQELRKRIRLRLLQLGEPALARQLDGAWISTIHGFCLRLLKAHPFAAGLDPRFRVLDSNQALVLQSEAFAAALHGFVAGGGPERTDLLATYGSRSLRRMLTGVYDTLRSAGRELVLELGAGPGLAGAVAAWGVEAGTLAADEAAGDVARERARAAIAFLAAERAPDELLSLKPFAGAGPGKASYAGYEEARKAVEQAALDELAAQDRDLLQELLERFAAAYAAAKERESALDFEDLQVCARDLLRDREDVRRREAWRFRSVFVDEFQDTNRLQCELVDLISGRGAGGVGAEGAAPGSAGGAGEGAAAGEGAEELFFVGDEFQSIYRFRHADVQVFRERRHASENLHSLTLNYRSRREVLGVVNHLFAPDFGPDFLPLEAAGTFGANDHGPAVELLVTDKATYKGAELTWREAEARHVAQRVREIVDSGEATPGEIVLLFAAGTDAEKFEQALRRLDLPTFRETGRNYYGQQQVLDLLAYLRLLHNRYDDESLVAVLASPFVGVSNDGLVALRRSASKRPLFVGLERAVPPLAGERDRQLFGAFKQRFERLAGQVHELSLERLCEEVVATHDYDLAVLAQWDGRRRYANLRKLGRLARSFEELRGSDIEGFVRFVRDQDDVGARELEAAAEEEHADVVRLLTIHAAKGLEFKVVVVADAGRDGATAGADEILVLPDGRFGFKVAHPLTGKRHAAFAYEAVKHAEEEAEIAERRRLYYVAMTRAIDRLIVSGSIDPAKQADRETPIGWVLQQLELEALDAAAPDSRAALVERDGVRLLLRVDRGAGVEGAAAGEAAAANVDKHPAAAAATAAPPAIQEISAALATGDEVAQLALFGAPEDVAPAAPPPPDLAPAAQPEAAVDPVLVAAPPVVASLAPPDVPASPAPPPGAPAPDLPALPALTALPVPPLHDLRRLSFSALALYDRCSYRWYVERVVGLREADPGGDEHTVAGLAATELGDAVHVVLEGIDLHDPAAPDDAELADRVRRSYPAATDEELARVGRFVRAYTESALARRIALLPARPERPFAFEHDGVLLRGRLDVLSVDGSHALVLDYKTNALGSTSPAEAAERGYRLQRLVYALACLRAGVEEVTVVYCFLERPDEPVESRFTQADLAALEAELSEAIERVRSGAFVPMPSEFACTGCPALGVVCAGTGLHDLDPR